MIGYVTLSTFEIGLVVMGILVIAVAGIEIVGQFERGLVES